MAIPFAYNVRNVMQRPVATLTTAIGVALTIAVLLAAFALAEGFRSTLSSTGSDANALVLRDGADSEVTSGLTLEMASILGAHPNVALAASGRPLASFEMVTTINLPRVGQKGASNIKVRGLNMDDVGMRITPKIVEGRTFTPGTDEIIVGDRIAPRFAHCRVGDEIKLQKRPFKVVGRFTTAGSSFESEIWGDARALAPVFHREGGYQIGVLRMKDPSAFEAMKKEWEADPRLGIQAKREREFYESQSAGTTGLIRGLGIFITGIMAIGALFGAANTMFAAVANRGREIATLLVLGFSPIAVMTSFVVESMIVALIGGVFGCLIALPINGITTSTTNFQSFSEVAFQFRVTPPLLVTALVFSAVLGALGGFFPALRAANQPLSRGLRGG
ncbi:MAG: ABC transporter permease [Candidatus Eisenbacteria bacterium]|uniref:ABC transporter permease n=1 Tax=Eiseniibacteriota bacterium TaxID=2212470 RepID=A0A933W328_UNCEI|nr:ABC transporter permease [Candidatus Eisenbacteria bacterium]